MAVISMVLAFAVMLLLTAPVAFAIGVAAALKERGARWWPSTVTTVSDFP